MRVLLVEDDAVLRRTIADKLRSECYDVLPCGSGDEGLYYLEQHSCDVAVIDRMLPDLDGVSLIRAARGKGISVPVLILTAMDAVGDRVDGLEAGADDYLVKPFDFRELLARIKALCRRPAAFDQEQRLKVGDLQLELDSFQLTGPKGQYHLSKKEGALLSVLMGAPGHTIPRNTLYNRVWGPDSDTNESNMESYVMFLRRRLAVAGSVLQIKNQRGIGYVLLAPEEGITH